VPKLVLPLGDSCPEQEVNQPDKVLASLIKVAQREVRGGPEDAPTIEDLKEAAKVKIWQILEVQTLTDRGKVHPPLVG
jgi:hypothetical protein